MNRSVFIAWLGVILVSACHTLEAAERPNILLILPDQMRASAMGCDGNAEVKTPNIDRLASLSPPRVPREKKKKNK